MSTKLADLTPPLGWYGGPCKVVQRIEDEVRTPALREDLSEKVEKGQKLTNPEAAKVYEIEAERGAGLFKQLRITPHAQYRMDQRAITVGDLRVFFIDFGKKLNDWKSQKSWEWGHYSEAMARGEPVEWVDKRIGDLKVVFAVRGPGVVDIVTTFWEGEPDPRPETCGHHQQHHQVTAREVEDMSPARTFVKEPSPSKSDTDKSDGDDGKYPTRGLPTPPWSRSKPTKGPPVLNVPGESGSNSDGNLHEDRARTKGTPGERSPPADAPARIGPTRRPGMTAEVVEPDIFDGLDPALFAAAVRLAGMYPPAYPGSNRQHKQRGQAYRYDHKRYRRQRGRILRRQKRRYRRYQSNGAFKADRARRKKNPERFDRFTGGGPKSIRERSRRQRQEKKAFRPVSFYLYDMDQYGWIIEVSPHGVVHFDLEGDGNRHTADMDTFFDEVIVDEARLDDLTAYLDEVFEYDPEEPEGDDADEGDDTDPRFDTWLEGRSKLAYQPRHRQKGQARRKTHQYYLRNRAAIQRRSKARYRHLKNTPAFKRQRKLRQDHPERYKLRMAYRLTMPDLGFVFITEEGLVQGTVRSVSGMSEQVNYWLALPGRLTVQMMPVAEFLLRAVFLSEEDTDTMFALVDEEVGLDAYDLDEEGEVLVQDEVVEEALEKLASEVLADFLRETRPPERDHETWHDRADHNEAWHRRDRKRLEDISEYSTQNDGNPGSKVLPSGAGHIDKEAALIADIQQGCAPDLVAKGSKLSVKLRRVDAQNTMWLFDVEGSKEPYRVRLQATRQGNVRSLAKAHVKVSCSCPFWRWQGPEHWAKQGDYLYGKPVGLATKPSVKDPTGAHRACKHVLAVLHMVTARKWDLPQLPSPKQAALRYLADTLDQGEVFMVPPVESQRIERVVARYLASQEVP